MQPPYPAILQVHFYGNLLKPLPQHIPPVQNRMIPLVLHLVDCRHDLTPHGPADIDLRLQLCWASTMLSTARASVWPSPPPPGIPVKAAVVLTARDSCSCKSARSAFSFSRLPGTATASASSHRRSWASSSCSEDKILTARFIASTPSTSHDIFGIIDSNSSHKFSYIKFSLRLCLKWKIRAK